MRTFALLAAVSALALSACSKSPDEQPISDENVETPLPAPDNAMPPPEVMPNTAENQAEALPPEPTAEQIRAKEAQVLDDADATGLTARVPVDEGAAANQADVQR
ncbi:MAG: hypothetical protein H0X36_11785 [Sphingomonadaceae bacterium]|nr:hypothetical protein [Sphingomonadaceae bacterium]